MTPSPMRRLDALVVGAGFSGLYLLHRLRDRGFAVRLVEASDGVGGVWRNNRYPGARVDSHVPNYEYSLEEVWRDWTWTERFPGRGELLAYFDHVVDVLDLACDIDLDASVESARFDGAEARAVFETWGGALRQRDGAPLGGFELAGEDRDFHPASAELAGPDTVVVRSAAVPRPVALRYAWANDPADANLVGEGDLPASPFRTDDWQVVTGE